MRSDIIVSGISNLLPATTGSAAAAAANAAVPALSNLIVTQAPSVAQSIQVTKPQMQTLYRGISAKTDDDLAQYIRDMVNKNIQPATYGGGNMQGEGYNFSTGKDTAEYFATRNPVKESRAILKTEVPMDRFIQQNEQNQNRLQDFVRRAEARGIPYENGESERQGLADMQRYFKKNGILGVKSHSGETYVINNNDDAWMKNLEVSDAMKGRRTRIEPDSNLLASLSDTMDIYNSAKRDLSPEVTKYLPDKATARYYLDDQNMGSVDLSGKPVVGQKVDLTNLPDSQYAVRRTRIPSEVDQKTGMGHVNLEVEQTDTPDNIIKAEDLQTLQAQQDLPNKDLNADGMLNQITAQKDVNGDGVITPEEAFSMATGTQDSLNKNLRAISEKLGYPEYQDVRQKSLESIKNKIERKGGDYTAMSMKDHARSKVMMNTWQDVGQTIKAIQEAYPDAAIQIENVKNPWGYNGLHLTFREPNGIGVEVQLTTPEHWPVKLESDAIYDKWRQIASQDVNTLPPIIQKRLKAALNKSKALWAAQNIPDLSMYDTTQQ